MYRTGDLSLDNLLDVLARAIEINPSNPRQWYQLVNTLTSENHAPLGDADQSAKCWWALRRQDWNDNFFHSPKSSTTKVKSEFVSIVLDMIGSDLFVMKEEADNGSIHDYQHDRPLSLDPICEALCLRVVVAYHMFGVCSFVCDSIWWISVKRWKSKQQGNNNDAYLDGLKWLSSQRLCIVEYLAKRREQSLAEENTTPNANANIDTKRRSHSSSDIRSRLRSSARKVLS